MKDLFKDIVAMDGIKGVMLLSFDGRLIYEEFNSQPSDLSQGRDWKPFVDAIGGVSEMDLVFDKGRIYIRKTDSGYLVVLMGILISIAMLRLNCDIVLPALKQGNEGKGFKRLFKK